MLQSITTEIMRNDNFFTDNKKSLAEVQISWTGHPADAQIFFLNLHTAVDYTDSLLGVAETVV